MGVALQRLKQGIVWTGSKVPKPRLLDVQMVVNYMRLGRWLRDHGYSFDQIVANRERCWDVAAEQLGHVPVLYLEFGVYEGAATRYWSKLLTHPDSQLHGFDSFEGLPETFEERQGVDRARFNVGGRIPEIDDPRVTFHKGWFEETLPGFEVPEHQQLIINFDADLYSSTMTILKHLDPWIVPGALLYFDELSYMTHEALALDDYIETTGKRFDGVVAEWSRNRAILRCVG
jgi:hypothetical protein